MVFPIGSLTIREKRLKKVRLMSEYKLSVIQTYKAEALIREIKAHLKDYSAEELDELCNKSLFFLYTQSFDAYE
jgi:hypothetical protein